MKRIRTPRLYQLEARECGAVALGIILAYYGKYVARGALRQACAVGRDGTTLSHMLRAARAYGLHPRAFQQVSISTLATLKPPFIIYWRFNHFLVVEGMQNGAFWVNDPALGYRKIAPDLMNDHFSGVVITFAVTPAWATELTPPIVWRGGIRRIFWGQGGQTHRFMSHITRLPLATFAQWYTQELVARVLAVRGVHQAGYGLYMMLMMGLLVIGYGLICLMWGGGMVIGLWLVAFVLFILQARMTQTAYHDQYDRPHADGIALNATTHMPSILLGGLSDEYIGRIRKTHAKNITHVQNTQSSLFIITQIITLMPVWMTLLYGAFSAHIPPLARFIMAGMLILGIHHLRHLTTLKAWRIMHINRLDRIAEIIAIPPDVPLPSSDTTDGRDGILPVITSPLNPLSILARGLQTARKRGFLPLLQHGEGGRGDEVKRIYTPSLLTNSHHTLRADGGDTNPMLICNAVRFAYTGSDTPQIAGFDMTVGQGQMVALVGRSGAGKSTLLAICAGAYPPQAGAVMRGAHPYALTSAPFLIHGTLRDNLAFGDVAISDDDMRVALSDVDLAAPLDMPIHPRHISAGMRQQIGLARILARHPRLLLLDEATSRIDPLTERHILARLRGRGCTVVIVSHRASTFIGADTIFVLDGGRVVEHGTHGELWDAGGVYRTVVV